MNDINTIDINQPVATIIKYHPELLDVLVEFGFKPLSNPIMLNSVGKKTSLKSGAKLIKVPLEQLKKTIEVQGYLVKGID